MSHKILNHRDVNLMFANQRSRSFAPQPSDWPARHAQTHRPARQSQVAGLASSQTILRSEIKVNLTNVRYWQKADISIAAANVRLWTKADKT